MSFDLIESVPVAGAVGGVTTSKVIGNKDEMSDGNTLAAYSRRIAGRLRGSSKVYPTGTAGCAVTSGASAFEPGSYAVLIPANTINYPFVLTDLVCQSSLSAVTYEFVFYTGADGAEQEICRVRRTRGAGVSDALTPLITPIISANAQVKVKMARNGTAQAQTISVMYVIPLGEAITAPAPVSYPANCIGFDGVTAFDDMSAAELAVLDALKVHFMHLSVGQSILDESDVLGYPFDYADSSTDYFSFNKGNLTFSSSDGTAKLSQWETEIVTNAIGGAVDLIAMKFCFTNFPPYSDEYIAMLKADYQARVANILSAYPEVAIVHFAPPLSRVDAYNARSANIQRIEWKTWLATTYALDKVIDMQDVESRDETGAQELSGGVPVLKSMWAADSAGHLNAAGARRCAKAMLYGFSTV